MKMNARDFGWPLRSPLVWSRCSMRYAVPLKAMRTATAFTAGDLPIPLFATLQICECAADSTVNSLTR